MYDFITINTTPRYFNDSKKISGSFDVKHYDEIITKIRIQAMQNYQFSREQQNEKPQKEEELHNQINSYII